MCAFRTSFAANYLTFTAEEDRSSFSLKTERRSVPDLQYSMDNGETWQTLDTGYVVTLDKRGDKCLLKGDNPNGLSSGYYDKAQFSMTGSIAASGSVMSLLDGVGESEVIPN